MINKHKEFNYGKANYENYRSTNFTFNPFMSP